MFRNLEANGSLAASMAVACVLSLAPEAGASGGVAAGPPIDVLSCCVAAETSVSGTDASFLLAQSADQPEIKPGAQTPPSVESARGEETGSADAASENGDRFRGSPKPAGRDLTVDEERDLISRGWD